MNGAGASRPDAGARKPNVLVLSTALLTDRMFLYSGCLQSLSRSASVRVWAASAKHPELRDTWKAAGAEVDVFPEVRPYKEFPYNYLRRLNEYVWDFRQRPPSRLSMMKHVRDSDMGLNVRVLKAPAHALAAMKAEKKLETWLEKKLCSYPRSFEAEQRLRANPPDIVVTTGPFWSVEPGVIAHAKKLGIPILAMIPSWDNVTTKNRMVYKYDGYLVWSEQTKTELHQFYEDTRGLPLYVVGAPQFDVFLQKRFEESREAFCARYGLQPNQPIVLYAIGSPNFIGGEYHGALQLAERMARGDLGDAQLIVRPHPAKDCGELVELFKKYSPRVVVQQVAKKGASIPTRSHSEHQITDWVSSFRHSDVMVNMFSTVTVDSALFDRPVVNVDFDPEPGQPNQALIKDVNHLWTHFKPVAESGGVWNVTNIDEMVQAIKGYLADPSLHRDKRRWIVERVCQFVDGRSGQRLAEAILDFAVNHAPQKRTP